ncbi:GFA family protein [Advenella mimigardefordensis]|uniref:Putative glutathione-dependent formaldehyde-activating enzyme n=1 Tax=Advenella mimigardefordensis (strain DSM 17166 / LMG 22922 / DPN7) TaxID=1247726 RepID=W0PBF2_ADVMD|nr:GFA family protein [Advenella mimigardefordensis]AHG64179.1 putative glutathione-dependent formaldehyde-activating enzyme [Advenella mimigardefordensis DPN7]
MKVEGQCHCGAIVYEADVTPGTVAICHCADCQMQSGSVFRMNIAAPADTFRICKGTPKKYIKVGDSGARRVHAFCDQCGGPVYSSAMDNPQTYSLRVGALKQRYELGKPVRQIWTKRRLPQIPHFDTEEEFDGQP